MKFLASSFSILLVSVLISQVTLAASPPASATKDDALKASLRAQMEENHNDAGYDRARIFMFGQFYLTTAKNGTYAVKDVYCDKVRISQEFKKGQTPGPNLVPGGNIINVEHTWPQSKFASEYDDEMQRDDLHHLFPSDTRMNAARANLDFGDVVESTQRLKCPVAKVGLNPEGEKVFEAPLSHKGNIARAMFYFSVRYNLSIDPVQEEVLRRWHQEDPIDQEEMARNDAIEKVQGNRNIFIDQPDLINQISDF